MRWEKNFYCPSLLVELKEQPFLYKLIVYLFTQSVSLNPYPRPAVQLVLFGISIVLSNDVNVCKNDRSDLEDALPDLGFTNNRQRQTDTVHSPLISINIQYLVTTAPVLPKLSPNQVPCPNMLNFRVLMGAIVSNMASLQARIKKAKISKGN